MQSLIYLKNCTSQCKYLFKRLFERLNDAYNYQHHTKDKEHRERIYRPSKVKFAVKKHAVYKHIYQNADKSHSDKSTAPDIEIATAQIVRQHSYRYNNGGNRSAYRKSKAKKPISTQCITNIPKIECHSRKVARDKHGRMCPFKPTGQNKYNIS